MCYLQSLIYKFLGLDVAGCGLGVSDIGLRALALCKRLHIGTTVSYSCGLGPLGVMSVVVAFECKKTHPTEEGVFLI